MSFKGIVAIVLLLMSMISTMAIAEEETYQINKGQIDEYVTREMNEGKIPGVAIGIVYEGEIIYLKGYGVKNAKNDPVTPQTPFCVGSVGKTFTALAIRQLEAKGRLDVEDPVTKHIPWFKTVDSTVSDQIKVVHLLNHTSGLTTTAGNEAYLYNSKYTLEELIRKLKNVHSNSTVGERFEYSNLNYLILGLIIEKASGLTYEEYIQTNIFNAIDMRNSYLSKKSADENGMAEGYRIVYGFPIQTKFPYPSGCISSGFQISSAEDMAKYLTCYLNNGYYNGKSVIPNNPLESIGKPYPYFRPTQLYYDPIWNLTKGYPKGYNGFDGFVGATPNFNSVMLMSQERKYGIVVLCNTRDVFYDPTITAQSIGNGISDIILGKGTPNTITKRANNLSIGLPIGATLLIVLRLIWLKRFKKNITGSKLKRIISFISFIMIDVILPILILIIPPILYDNNWAFFLGTNPEYSFNFFVISICLLFLGIRKASILIKLKNKS